MCVCVRLQVVDEYEVQSSTVQMCSGSTLAFLGSALCILDLPHLIFPLDQTASPGSAPTGGIRTLSAPPQPSSAATNGFAAFPAVPTRCHFVRHREHNKANHCQTRHRAQAPGSENLSSGVGTRFTLRVSRIPTNSLQPLQGRSQM